MIKVGINGLGRIGKCVLIQLLESTGFSIQCINVTSIKITEIEEYLRQDSTHHYNKNFTFKIISNTQIALNEHKINIFSDRDPKNLNWDDYGCEYLFDCTGSFLTTEKCSSHKVKYVIMSSPAKDSTPTYIYGVNDDKYMGEHVVSGSSCTTNCLSPMLKFLNDKYNIADCVFTTIHAVTASQFVVDIPNNKARTSRTCFNNIIPHTTGASKSIYSVLPELTGLVNGTSIRVPVSNCSLVDLNVQLTDTNTRVSDIQTSLLTNPLYSTVFNVTDKNVVSSDFITTTTPTILDITASIDMGNGKFKLMLWYDNEWSYSAQLIRLCNIMWKYNNNNDNNNNLIIQTNINTNKYYISNINFENKNVVLRLDLNVPIDKNFKVIDDFKIASAIPTINTILNQNPKRLIITSHFGRPVDVTMKYSLYHILYCLIQHVNKPIEFLEDCISIKTLDKLMKSNSKIFLLENLRFHKEETNSENIQLDLESNPIVSIYSMLGDIFISDAFGCVHRAHMSISGIKEFELKQNKIIGYGHLIHKEISYLKELVSNDKKILCIIGGNKISDKLPIIESFKHLPNAKIFVAGGLAKYYFPDTLNTFVMEDGMGNTDTVSSPCYISDIKNTNLNAYDIGYKSKKQLFDLILQSDIIFWNGSLGVIEHDFYKNSSLELVNFLESNKQLKIIMGGGETSSIISNKNSNIYVSTGGGALLEYLENKFTTGNNIPGIKIYE
jgi:glyceraldehyde 3-phosphate dehydrogenase